MDFYKPYIQDLKKGYRTLFEGFGGFSIGKWEQELEVLDKINELEKKYGFYVYAVTHEYTTYGDMYDMLIVPKYEDEWDSLTYDIDSNTCYVYAYCWNKDCDDYSEFGDVVIRSFGGGIKRVG